MKHMDQTRTSCTAGVSELPAAAGSEPAKRTIGGDAPAAEPGCGCFDCSICLDSAADPVVTLCGHLYCWSCIYEWLLPETDADAAADADFRSSARRQCCPVCKAAVTPDALVPLYGRGSSSRHKKTPRGVRSILRRPAVRQNAQESDHHHRDVQTDRPTQGPRQARHHAGAAELDFPLTSVVRGPQHDALDARTDGDGSVAMGVPWPRAAAEHVLPEPVPPDSESEAAAYGAGEVSA